MLLFYKLRRLKLDIALILMICTAHLISVQSHVCMLVKRPDPSRGDTLRWSMPKDDLCHCQGVVAPNMGSACPGRDKYEAGELWFVDDPRLLTRRTNWRADILDDLLQRIEFCANECTLKTDNCSINAVCADTLGSFTCTCIEGYAGDGTACFDVEDPQFSTCPSGETIHTDPGKPTARVVWDTPRAIDNSGIVGVSCDYKQGSYFPIGNTMVQCTADDESGNKEECHFTVSVEDIEDPGFETCPLDTTISTDPGKPTAMVVWDQPKASDNSGKINVSCNYNPATDFPIGNALVRCTAFDESGNTEECHFMVSVKDNEKPGLENCPNITTDANPGLHTAVVAWKNPEAHDNSGIVNVSCSYNSGANFNIGDTVVDCRAVDGSGNENECYFVVSVQDFDECITESHNCSANAACTNTDGGYNCSCNQGYKGDGFECVDINECQNGGNNCDENAGCTNTDGSYTCACDVGYSGNGVTCIDINECQDGGNNCDINAGCTNTEGSFTCACDAGYTGNGVTCSDINECQYDGNNNCAYNARCTNTAGSYTCACNTGYGGNGFTCGDINECQYSGNNNCAYYARCTNTQGSYRCTCNTGYSGNGFTCSDINECLYSGNNNCAYNARCTNTAGSYTCACNYGYSGNGFTCYDSTTLTVRLRGGSHSGEGRVEIRHNGVWGTVCDDYWDTEDAMVVCRQLGYPLSAVAKTSAYFGQGIGTIWLDDVDCTGSQSRLEYCAKSGWGDHNCGHQEDAGVVCG